MSDYNTIEYILPESKHNINNTRPICMLIVDTAVSNEELSELKDSL